MSIPNQTKVKDNNTTVVAKEPGHTISLGQSGKMSKVLLAFIQVYTDLMEQLKDLYVKQINIGSQAIDDAYDKSISAAGEEQAATNFQAGASIAGGVVAMGAGLGSFAKSRGANQDLSRASLEQQGLERMQRDIGGANNGNVVAAQGNQAGAGPGPTQADIDAYLADVRAGRFGDANGHAQNVQVAGRARLTDADRAHVQGLVDTQSRNVNSAELRLQGIRSNIDNGAKLIQGLSDGGLNILSAEQKFKSRQDEADATKKSALQNLAKESYEDASQQRKALAQEQISETDALQRILSSANARG